MTTSANVRKKESRFYCLSRSLLGCSHGPPVGGLTLRCDQDLGATPKAKLDRRPPLRHRLVSFISVVGARHLAIERGPANPPPVDPVAGPRAQSLVTAAGAPTAVRHDHLDTS